MRGNRTTNTIRCAWCGTKYRTSEKTVPDSHGLCTLCSETLKAEMAIVNAWANIKAPTNATTPDLITSLLREALEHIKNARRSR